MHDFIALNHVNEKSGVGTYAGDITNILSKERVFSIIVQKEKTKYSYDGTVMNGYFPPITSGWNLNRRFYKRIIRKNGYQVPEYIHFLGAFFVPEPKQKGIITYHDLYYLHRNVSFENYRHKLNMKFLNWENVIADTGTTRDDLLKEGFDESRITVVHLSLSDFWHRVESPSKDVVNEISRRNRDDKPVVLTNGDGFNKNNPTVREVLKKSGKYFHIHVGRDVEADYNLVGIEMEVLRDVYNIADVYIRLASFEGFGYPPLESLFCGTPVVVSDIETYHEVLGDAAVFTKSEDGNILDALEYAIEEKDQLVGKFNSTLKEHYRFDRFKKEMIEYYRARDLSVNGI